MGKNKHVKKHHFKAQTLNSRPGILQNIFPQGCLIVGNSISFYMISCVICVALGGMLIAILSQFHQSNSKREITIGQNIANAIEACRAEMKNLEELNSFLSGDNELATHRKSILRPIQERISSLRIQINQYENMKQIPGGPKYFIHTTLAELEQLQKRLLEIQLEMVRITSASASPTDALYRRHFESLSKSEIFASQESMQVLGGWGVFIAPGGNDDVEAEDMHKYTNGKTLEEVLLVFEKLGALFDDLAEAKDQANEELVKHKLPKLSSTGKLQLEPHQQIPEAVEPFLDLIEQSIFTLKKVIKKNQETYRTFIPLTILLRLKLTEALPKLLTYETDQVGLITGILTSLVQEMKNLRTRVNNLKVVYTKTNTKGKL